MADIELDDLRNCRDGSNGFIAQAVSRMAFQADRFGMRGRGDETLELKAALCARGVAIGAGMQFDDGGIQCPRRVELPHLGIDEQRDTDAATTKSVDDR